MKLVTDVRAVIELYFEELIDYGQGALDLIISIYWDDDGKEE